MNRSASHSASDPTGSEAYLRLDAVTKRYGDKTVVNAVSLGVGRGEVLTILGPSGCGKTTTLKIIAGFLQPNEGSVIVEGKGVDNLSSHQRGAAMVFQNYALFPHMTVAQNVAFGLRMKGLPKADIARQVQEMLSRVRLAEYAERFPKELSGGQQQRVALARALIIRPKVLLLDEPFSSLDAKLRKQLRLEFLEIHRNFGITSVFVTHDLEEAFAISDKVAVMNGGRLEQLGAPTDIFSRPQSRFVADFVGHKNILNGVSETGADGRPSFRSGDIVMRTTAEVTGPAVVSVPIHRVEISRDPLALDNNYRAEVQDVAFLGPVIQTTVRMGDALIESYRSSTSVLAGMRQGDPVHVGWNAEDVVVIPEAAAQR